MTGFAHKAVCPLVKTRTPRTLVRLQGRTIATYLAFGIGLLVAALSTFSN